jgi:hypothetical protein
MAKLAGVLTTVAMSELQLGEYLASDRVLKQEFA